MKKYIYAFAVIAVFLFIFNLLHINIKDPFNANSFAASAGAIASLCALILLFILDVARRIKEKIKKIK